MSRVWKPEFWWSPKDKKFGVRGSCPRKHFWIFSWQNTNLEEDQTYGNFEWPTLTLVVHSPKKKTATVSAFVRLLPSMIRQMLNSRSRKGWCPWFFPCRQSSWASRHVAPNDRFFEPWCRWFAEIFMHDLERSVLHYTRPGAVKLVLCGHWMHLSYIHQWRQRTNFTAPSCTLLSDMHDVSSSLGSSDSLPTCRVFF